MALLDLNNALEFYMESGFDPIPLKPGTKTPSLKNWPRESVFRMWNTRKPYSNIGIRCGGLLNVAVIDCDDKDTPGTFDNVRQLLETLGYVPGDYPVIQTASGIGRHIYLTFNGELPGDICRLDKVYGSGEFRYGPGAYVVAPPSVVSFNGLYSLIEGNFRRLPEVERADIEPLLNSIKDELRPVRKSGCLK